MITFFYFDKTISVTHQEIDFKYEHRFEKAELNEDGISANHIYFSTPSDFHNHVKNINKQSEEKFDIHVVPPDSIFTMPNPPCDIGFQNLEEALISHQGKKTFKVAIINAMSNAMGDHLIGMQAFDVFYDRLHKLMPGVDIEINLFQINPYRLSSITAQWSGKYKNIYMLPNRLSLLMAHDAFVDLGALIIREKFNNQPMIDFFLESLSIDPTQVSPDLKRNKFTISRKALSSFESIFHNIRLRNRPILLFHHTSTTNIRQMTESRARMFVKEIIDKSDYFVVSADRLEFQHERFRSLHSHSKDINDFAEIISNVDAIVTVDTLTYHLADVFDIPTVVLFTTIDPQYRIKYYPHVKGIILDTKLYGMHKAVNEQDDVQYLDEKWANVDIDKMLQMITPRNHAS